MTQQVRDIFGLFPDARLSQVRLADEQDLWYSKDLPTPIKFINQIRVPEDQSQKINVFSDPYFQVVCNNKGQKAVVYWDLEGFKQILIERSPDKKPTEESSDADKPQD